MASPPVVVPPGLLTYKMTPSTRSSSVISLINLIRSRSSVIVPSIAIRAISFLPPSAANLSLPSVRAPNARAKPAMPAPRQNETDRRRRRRSRTVSVSSMFEPLSYAGPAGGQTLKVNPGIRRQLGKLRAGPQAKLERKACAPARKVKARAACCAVRPLTIDQDRLPLIIR